MGLVLHTGANVATMEQVRAVATPEQTKSYIPVAHHDIIDAVRGELVRDGFAVRSESHGLWNDGARYFGLMETAGEHDYALTVGIRNSHDKRFPASIALGSNVFVCDNLSFSGEVSLARRHTVNIMRDLPGLIQRAVGQLADIRKLQSKRIEAYKAAEVTKGHDVASLILAAVNADVIGKTMVYDVMTEWHTPRHAAFLPRTAWSLFNSFTEILKGNLPLLPARTQKLHGLLDSHVGLLAQSV